MEHSWRGCQKCVGTRHAHFVQRLQTSVARKPRANTETFTGAQQHENFACAHASTQRPIVMEKEMRRKFLMASSLLGAFLGCLSLAQAAEPGFYVGAGIGNAGFEVDGNDPDLGDIDDLEFEGDDVGYKLLAGYRVA